MRIRPLVATTLLIVFAVAPLALAQSYKAKKPKKGASTAASASASASDTATAPPASAAPQTASPSAASASASGSSESAVPEPPPEPEWDNQNTYEDPKETYYFIGARYRGTIIPQFIENLFIDDGATAYSNTVGLELDMRKEGHSTIPWITYTDYGLGNTLFLQKGKSGEWNTTMVNSTLKAVFLGLDEVWSIPLEPNHKVDYEFGFGVGLGFIFGNLYNDWVYSEGVTSSTPGAVKGADGNYYLPCPNTSQGGASSGCNPSNHTDPSPAKVNNYVEPNWFNGGGVPVVFPRLSLQFLGVRYKPIKQLEMRFGAGFALTEGFWFQISGDYGLEKKKETRPKASTSGPSVETF